MKSIFDLLRGNSNKLDNSLLDLDALKKND